MMSRQPEGPPPPPVVQRVRLHYTKRDRLRFTSHRDFQRAFERALRRGGVPVALSAGFTPHPRVSYAGAAPTGMASEAEYLELALARVCDPDDLCRRIGDALPDGFDVLAVVPVRAPGSLADTLEASLWRLELVLAGGTAALASAVDTFLAAERVPVTRRGRDGERVLDARAAVVRAAVCGVDGDDARCATMDVVVRHVTPAVRPDDVLAALRQVAGITPTEPPLATRLAQGLLGPDGQVVDPLARDRQAAAADAPGLPERGEARAVRTP